MNIAVKAPFVWTEEITATAAEMWNAGISGTVIARTIGASRNAVISKAHRTQDLFTARHGAGKGIRSDLGPRKPAKGIVFQRSRKSKQQREAERLLHLERLAMPDPNSYDAERLPHAKTLLDRGPRECCWPVNSGGPFLYCAAEATDGPTEGSRTYCRHHHLRMLPARPVADMGAK
jgi:GcrA cell cycle regulator